MFKIEMVKVGTKRMDLNRLRMHSQKWDRASLFMHKGKYTKDKQKKYEQFTKEGNGTGTIMAGRRVEER